MESTPELTEEDFVPNDSAESRLLPLLKRICESEILELAERGLNLLYTLRRYKPVEHEWVNEAMTCWREHPNLSVQLQNTEDLFQAMIDLSDEYPSLEPDRYSYGFVVSARTYHARATKNMESMQRAERYLTDMWARWEESQALGIETNREHPVFFLYRIVFRGWMRFARADRSNETYAYQKALSVLMTMKDLFLDGFNEFTPDARFQRELTSVGYHLNKCGIVSLPALEAIVGELEASFDGECQPDQLKLFAETRREMMSRYMQNKRLDTESTISRILPLMNEWWETCRNAEDPFTRLNTIYMNKFITAAGRRNIGDAFPRSQALIQEMWRLYRETGNDSIKPDHITYNSLTDVLSRSTTENAGEKASALLQEMWDLYNSDRTQNEVLKPDRVTYSAMIQVWVKSGEEHAGDEAEKLLQEMWGRYHAGDNDLMPDIAHHNQVIMSYLGSTNGANRATTFLRDIWDRYYSDTEKNEAPKPDAITYGSVIQVWVKSEEKNAVEQAEALMREMWDRCNAGDEDLRPRNIDYNQIISALFHLGSQGVDRAQALFEEMWDLYNSDKTSNRGLKPDKFTYSSMMKVWVTSNDEKASAEAERLLQDMWDRYDDGDDDLRPTNIEYNQVIAAWSKLGEGADRAEELFQEMWTLYNETGDESIKPNFATYNWRNRAISNSKRTRNQVVERSSSTATWDVD